MKKTPNSKAFTFAETLVAILIIGVIGALTIPPLKNHADEQKYVNLAKKVHNEITSAVARAETKYGDSQFWESGKANTYYKEIFDTVPTSDENLKGTIDLSLVGGPTSAIIYHFQTNDGFLWQIEDISNTKDKQATMITTDTNGLEPPNVQGIDIHVFEIDENGVTAKGCTAYVLKQSKMPWLKQNMTTCPTN